MGRGKCWSDGDALLIQEKFRERYGPNAIKEHYYRPGSGRAPKKWSLSTINRGKEKEKTRRAISALWARGGFLSDTKKRRARSAANRDANMLILLKVTRETKKGGTVGKERRCLKNQRRKPSLAAEEESNAKFMINANPKNMSIRRLESLRGAPRASAHSPARSILKKRPFRTEGGARSSVKKKKTRSATYTRAT